MFHFLLFLRRPFPSVPRPFKHNGPLRTRSLAPEKTLRNWSEDLYTGFRSREGVPHSNVPFSAETPAHYSLFRPTEFSPSPSKIRTAGISICVSRLSSPFFMSYSSPPLFSICPPLSSPHQQRLLFFFPPHSPTLSLHPVFFLRMDFSFSPPSNELLFLVLAPRSGNSPSFHSL